MDFVRLFQNIHDPLSSKKANTEIDKLKEMIMEKDIIIENYEGKINELELTIKNLETANQSSNTRLDIEMNEIMDKYEQMISSTLTSFEHEKQEKEVAQNHLARLETAFRDLIEKYERAKQIIAGYQENETSLLNHITEFEDDLIRLKDRYTNFKAYALKNINEANATINTLKKDHAKEIKDLEEKLQDANSKIKILESDNFKNNKSYSSIFQPLVTNFK